MAPGEYHAKDDLEFVNNQHFQREGSQAQLLVEGGVDDDEFLTRVNETRTDAADDDGIAYTQSDRRSRHPGPALDDGTDRQTERIVQRVVHRGRHRRRRGPRRERLGAVRPALRDR